MGRFKRFIFSAQKYHTELIINADQLKPEKQICPVLLKGRSETLDQRGPDLQQIQLERKTIWKIRFTDFIL